MCGEAWGLEAASEAAGPGHTVGRPRKEIAMPAALTLKDAVPQFVEHLRAAGKKDRTVRIYRTQLGVAAEFFGEGKTLKALRPADVGRFLKSDALLKKSSGKDRAQPTVDQIVRCLRLLFEWAVEQGHIEMVPFPKDALPKRRRKTQEESDAAPQSD
jgi:site-specific recombinase XerD